MKAHVRAAVAAIAYSAATGRPVKGVYDYSTGQFITVEGAVVNGQAKFFDYSRGAHIEGQLNNLFDYGEGSFIEMKGGPSKIEGFDYGSGNFYEVTFNGREISLFDYGGSGYSTYEAAT